MHASSTSVLGFHGRIIFAFEAADPATFLSAAAVRHRQATTQPLLPRTVRAEAGVFLDHLPGSRVSSFRTYRHGTRID